MTPARMVLELTEREAIRDPERLREALLGVQMAGVRVAADDVGAGNAGLRLLSQFQFDVVKIDLSLVQRAGDDKTHSVLRSIVEMANRLGATTIAEGVETSGQLRTARRLGINAGQGYLLGRPGSGSRPAVGGHRRPRAARRRAHRRHRRAVRSRAPSRSAGIPSRRPTDEEPVGGLRRHARRGAPPVDGLPEGVPQRRG